MESSVQQKTVFCYKQHNYCDVKNNETLKGYCIKLALNNSVSLHMEWIILITCGTNLWIKAFLNNPIHILFYREITPKECIEDNFGL